MGKRGGSPVSFGRGGRAWHRDGVGSPRTYLGVDFSGNDASWKASARARSNVWVAEAVETRAGLRLARIDRVQGRYPKASRPFEALSRELSERRHEAVGIDAPFSVPAAHVPRASHAELLLLARSVVREAKRDFARGADLREAIVRATREPDQPKPLRVTEAHWVKQGVNTRSTLWAGARGGAPMTAACLELVARAEVPLWPWVSHERGVAMEVFPAAQLRTWGLPFTVYDASKDDVGAQERRRVLVKALSARIDLGDFASVLLASADAIDAVVSVFGAIAMRQGRLASEPSDIASIEGWIAVHV